MSENSEHPEAVRYRVRLNRPRRARSGRPSVLVSLFGADGDRMSKRLNLEAAQRMMDELSDALDEAEQIELAKGTQ